MESPVSKHQISAILLVLVLFSATLTAGAMAQGGRGRAGGAGRAAAGRSGGASRQQIHAPSMSRSVPSTRPAVSRPAPNINRPTVSRRPASLPGHSAGQRPSLPGNRPDFGGISSRPSQPGNRPDFGGITSRPNTPATRPDFGGLNNRPGVLPATRPSQGNLRDFLDMPGDHSRPATLPSFGAGNGSVGNRPGGDRIHTGDIHINAGNSLNISRTDNIQSIRSSWANASTRPFGHDHWVDPGYSHPNWHYHSHWHQYPGNWCWHNANWAAFGTWFVWSAWTQPVVYSYGTNVVYRDNYVYINDQPAATTEVYYQQADAIATSAPRVADESRMEWMPLGVFAVASGNGDDTGMIVQLAISREGVIAGTFHNQTTGTDRPVEGQVDRETQRAAWKFSDGKNGNVVMETGIDNLTKDESTALVHFGPDETQTWTLVRLPGPEEESGSRGGG